jgi:HNH endonuclease
MPTKPMNQQERIRRATERDWSSGCWNWKLHKDSIGYGRLKISLGSRDKWRDTSAHRYAYELWIGPIPPGKSVLHKCDNRGCCNPEHLFLGTQQDNIRDMHAKGRGPRGYKRNAETCAANAMKRRAALEGK